jgi:hypothetical protein
MKHRIESDKTNGLLIVTTEGDAAVEGIFAFLDDIISHPDWLLGMSLILDHRRLNLGPISAQGIEQVSDYFAGISGKLGNGKMAMVMNKDVDFGIARASEIITQDRTNMKLHVFRTLDEAWAWIKDSSPIS